MAARDPKREEAIGQAGWEKLKIAAANLSEPAYTFIANLPEYTQKCKGEPKEDVDLKMFVYDLFQRY